MSNTELPAVLFIHQHRYQQRYYQRLCATNAQRFNGKLAYYWQPRGISAFAPSLSGAELQTITAFQLRKRRLRGQSTGLNTERLLALRAQYEYRLWYRLLANNKPDLLAFWNGNNPGYRAARLAADKLDIACAVFENGPLANTTTCDFRGVNARNSLPRDPAFYRRYATQAAGTAPPEIAVRTASGDMSGSSSELPADRSDELPDEYIFVAFQVHEDSQLLACSPQLGSMWQLYSWLQQLVAITGQTLVIKEHPSCKQNYSKLHQRDEKIIFSNRLSTRELIARSSGVVTVNSTVGLEAIILGKPVITLGAAFYNLPGLTVTAGSPGELAKAVSQLSEWQFDETLRQGFVHFFSQHYLLPGDWRHASAAHCAAVGARLTALPEWLTAPNQ